MSDSPRTDTHILANVAAINHAIVCHDFARQLERELNLMTEGRRVDNLERVEERDRLRAELENVKHNLKGSRSGAGLVYETMLESGKEAARWRAMAKELAVELEYGPVAGCKGTALARFNELEKSI